MDAGIVSPELAKKLAARPGPASESFKGLAAPEGTVVQNAPSTLPMSLGPGISANPFRGRDSMMTGAGGGPAAISSIDPMMKSLESALRNAMQLGRSPGASVTLQEALAGDYKNLIASSASVS